MKQLSASVLEEINGTVIVPPVRLMQLPEKVLQFGTGVLLRGLPDYFIDKANRAGVFNGRIVVVKSTGVGTTDAFDEQDALFTTCIRGIEGDLEKEELVINSAISRVLPANTHWERILDLAGDPEMQLVISNTTESGIIFVEEDIRQSPPVSFPGKLLSFLYRRYTHFQGSAESGMVIVPTELIPGNGNQLRSVVMQLAMFNKMDHAFISWLETSNEFCNSLVDRIVPGVITGEAKLILESELGYSDELMIMAETFRFWAIETDSARVKDVLSFAAVDDGVVITSSVRRFSELKLRILNGSHSFSCAVALLAGFDTVRQAMDDVLFRRYIEQLMYTEIAVAVESSEITRAEAEAFAAKVIDRFRNPFIEHRWTSIAVNYSSKLPLRSLPLIERYVERTGMLPWFMAVSVAAYVVYAAGDGDINTFILQLAADNKLPPVFVDELVALVARIKETGITSLLQEMPADNTTV